MSAIKNAGFILASTVWVSICEFSRNQLWLQSYWVEHYAKMGLTFPSQPINGAMWGGMGVAVFCCCVYYNPPVYLVAVRSHRLAAGFSYDVGGNRQPGCFAIRYTTLCYPIQYS